MINLRSGNTEVMGIGGYLPGTRVKTSEVVSEIDPSRYGIEIDFFERTMGIRESRFADEKMKPSDLATLAAEDMFNHCDVSPSEIGMVIFCGIDRDNNEPSTAHRVQKNLGIPECIVFDISNACHGFMDGVNTIDAFISTGVIRYGLVVTGEIPSQVTKSLVTQLKAGVSEEEFKFKIGALSTGDSGGAMLIGKKQTRGIEMAHSCSRGEFVDLCFYRKTSTGIEGQLLMGPLCANALKMHKTMYEDSLRYLEWNPEDIDHLVTHQVGNKSFDRFSKIFQVDSSKMTRTYPDLGNLITATVPINLWQLDRAGQLENKRVFVAGSGSGLSVSQWGIKF